mgnify:CR=1 FL=1
MKPLTIYTNFYKRHSLLDFILLIVIYSNFYLYFIKIHILIILSINSIDVISFIISIMQM